MADNDATIADLQAQIATLLAEKAARDAEDEERSIANENRPKNPELAKQTLNCPRSSKCQTSRRFNGTSNPASHVCHVINTLKPMGLNDELIAQLFQRTLTGSALDWFLTLEFEHYHTWPEIANAFIKQYAYNVVELTTQDLEMIKQ
ncbi:hypothetical protein RHMOL_Rhmol04G0223700 [Rhododendron molle]|uniref:Uncharacterized protein n=1 Tax=Rhododendron molle TaxID=49168 RepID=A0ACC0P5D1_RHOML|nr:hypothetical protein RHMOL_Rhmol04G0223700 [Rhododendron molle]